ncbi:MAG: FAD-dependent oxidoreductase [Saprospiraceae bacterium]|nr:FAD-dependent oxidoreductase [Saprospiraceae bacterium]
MSPPRFLVIGQGIAGTVLSFVLRRQGADVTLADAGFRDAASAAAAGIINPITGKNYVKSWRADDLLPSANRIYGEMERSLGIPLRVEQPVFRLLSTPQERNNWDARAGLPDYAPYLGNAVPESRWTGLLHPHFTFGAVTGGGRINFGALLPAYRTYARDHGFLLEATIDPDRLPAGFDAWIFCEGYRGASNPLFAHLPWQPNKGEALLVRFPDLRPPWPESMLKKTVLVTHLADGLYWAGAPYFNRFDDPYPTPEGHRFVAEGLAEMFAVPFTVEDHVAGIRPAVAGRRPLIGRLPGRSGVVLFNGWGAKGASLVPFWAEHLAAHLIDGAALDAEVDLNRFR